MMKENRKIVYQSNVNIYIDVLLMPSLLTAILTSFYIFEMINLNTLILGILVFISIVIFEIKQFTVFCDSLEIKYVLLKIKKEFKLDAITLIKFYSNDTAYDSCVVKIYTERESSKYYFLASSELQGLIDKLRELGIKVEVNSNIWK